MAIALTDNQVNVIRTYARNINDLYVLTFDVLSKLVNEEWMTALEEKPQNIDLFAYISAIEKGSMKNRVYYLGSCLEKLKSLVIDLDVCSPKKLPEYSLFNEYLKLGIVESIEDMPILPEDLTELDREEN